MPESPDRSLAERVERLEAIVARLEQERASRQATAETAARASAVQPVWPPREENGAARPAPPRRPAASSLLPAGLTLPERIKSSEFWLNKIGIGLLLFGVAFLFRYSINRGWLTPPVRVAFGLLLGFALIAVGLRLRSGRRHFGHVLVGGGIAAFYITGFAAFQIFALVPHVAAFGFMVGVTLVALVFSIRYDAVVLALIGAAGGLGTPFLLYTDSGSLAGLIGYTCLVLCGTMAIHFLRGWRSLLWLSVLGGWCILLVGLAQGVFDLSPRSDQWALQAGIIFCWLAFWLVPLARVGTQRAASEADEDGAPGEGGRLSRLITGAGGSWQVQLFCVAAPLLTLVFSAETWSLSLRTTGWISLGGAVVYGLLAWRLTGLPVWRRYAFAHALVSGLLLTSAIYLLLEGSSLLFVLAGEAAALHFLARRRSDWRVAACTHLLSGLTAFWLLARVLTWRAGEIAFLNLPALTDLWTIGLAVVVSIWVLARLPRLVYQLVAHLALLGLFIRELAWLPNGQAWVSIAWGIYGLVLIVVALRLGLRPLRFAAMGTLLLVVGKLFLVDLAQLDPLWRVLLFIGFGGIFLLLSYYFRALWRTEEGSGDP